MNSGFLIVKLFTVAGDGTGLKTVSFAATSRSIYFYGQL